MENALAMKLNTKKHAAINKDKIMNYRLFKKLIFSAILLSAPAKAELNDIGPWDYVTLDAHVFSAYDYTDNQRKTYVQMPHVFTNTLSCDLTIPVKINTENGGFTVRDVKMMGVALYTNASFGFEMTILVPTPLKSGENVDDFIDTWVKAHCHGWDGSIPLPESLCLNKKLNPGHDKTCKLLTNGQRIYPWIRNGSWLGSCSCDSKITN